ncbi:beta strand repeat-containing protein [Lactococcus termiticola]|uniref:beta strand repeat-containing protein n=1 Tax=Lactococcus termiticola TaxID=2169526 RepID=UPI0014022CAD|nr:hypothetical protein [Lactococcus termiticola]
MTCCLLAGLPTGSIASLFSAVKNESVKPGTPLISSLYQELTQPHKVSAATDVPVTMANNNFGYTSSVAGNVTKTGITVLSSKGTAVYSSTTVSDANVQAALYAIYKLASPTSDYALYIGADVSLSSATMAKTVISQPTASNMNFASLTSSYAKSLTVISDPADSLTSGPSQDTASAVISLPQTAYLGVNTAFRNITLAGSTKLYAQGNNLSIRGGAYFTGSTVNIYGGTDSGNVAQTNLWFASTGSGTLNIYGGNDSAGTVTGSTAVSLTNTSGGTVNAYAGGNAGSVSGNTNLTYNSSNATTANLYGAFATSGTVTGNSFVDVLGATAGKLNVTGTAPNGKVAGNVNLGLSNLSGTTVGTIYGDGATTAPTTANTKRLITVSVNSPGYNFTNDINASNYNLASNSGLLSSSLMNINAATVPQISGGADGNDNFTNSSTAGNTNTATLYLGSRTASPAGPGKLTANLIHNFTSLNLLANNELNLSASSGYIYNGGTGVTSTASYQSSYSGFGQLNMGENSGIVDNSLGGGTLNSNNELTPNNVMIQVGA